MTTPIISSVELERFSLNELPAKRIDAVNHLRLKHVDLQQRLNKIQQSNAEILALYPSDLFVTDVLRRKEGRSGPVPLPVTTPSLFSPRRKLHLSIAVCAVLMALILFIPGGRTPINQVLLDPGQDTVLIKGLQSVNLFKTQLLVYRKNERRVEQLQNGDRAEAGDLLQLAYVADKAQYGVILSIDGKGDLTVHLPIDGDEPFILERNKQVALSYAIELDEAPVFERFFFLTSMVKMDAEVIREAARQLARKPQRARTGDLKLPADINQYSITILKGGSK